MKTRIPLTLENVRRYLPRSGGVIVNLSDNRLHRAWESHDCPGLVYVCLSEMGGVRLAPPCDGWAIEIERPGGCWKRRLKPC